MPLRLRQRAGSRIWYLRGTVRGQPVYESTGTQERGLAEAARAKREAELFEGAVFGVRATVSFRRAALAYIDFTPRSRATKRYVLRLIDHFGDARLKTIDQVAADAAVLAIVGGRAAPATKIRAVYTPLTAILHFAAARQWCAPPRFLTPTPPDGRTRWLAPAEARRLIDGAAPHLRPLLLFLLCTGARLGEALDLDWDDVDLAGARAVFRGTKARMGQRRDRIAALPPAAVATLANLPLRDGRVFRRDDGLPYADRARLEGGQIATAFATACRRARLIEWRRRAEPCAEAEGPHTPVAWAARVTPHNLRHSWATWFYALSKDLLLLKDEGGWRTLRMVERYAHLMPPALAPEVASIWGPSHPRLGALPRAKSGQAVARARKSA